MTNWNIVVWHGGISTSWTCLCFQNLLLSLLFLRKVSLLILTAFVFKIYYYHYCFCSRFPYWSWQPLFSKSIIMIIIMYIYHVLINTLSTHMIHINLNMIFYTHVEHSPTKTIYIKYYTKTKQKMHYKHTHTHTHTHTVTVAETGYWY